MDRTAGALLALAVLIAAGQWLFARNAGHIDLHLVPAHSRRRAQWLLANSTHVLQGAFVLLAAAAAVQVVSVVR